MTYDEYWNEEPERTVMYRKASYIQAQTKSYDSWLQGLYNYDALAKALSNAFAKKGAKAHKYIEKPIDVLPKSDEQRLKDAEKQRRALELQLTAWADSFNKR